MVVKKAIVFLFAVFYLGIASGVVVNIHYCMGQVASIQYGHDKHDECGKCGMKEKKGCCHTESKIIKLQDAHQLAKVNFNLPETAVESFSQIASLIFTIPSQEKYLSLSYHSPPDKRDNAVYLHNCVFRI